MVLEKLAEYGAWEAGSGLPAAVWHHAKRAVLDWFSALYAGVSMAPSRHLIQAHRSELGLGYSSLPGNATTAFAATAAWINGATSHAAEFDDIFRDAAYHPGCPVISAALAVAEEHARSGQDFLRAVIVGYEISTRIGTAMQPDHYRYFHPTGTVGCLGAAAAASVLLASGDKEVMKHALATSATFASGLQQAFRSDAMTKALHAGHAACMGVRAAQLAAHGVTGAQDMLEGPVGFGTALSGTNNWSAAVDRLGEHYNITQITQKAYGCCGHTFAALDAGLELRRRFSIVPGEIEAIRVRTYQTAVDVTGSAEASTPFQARFSLPYVLAHALVHGAVRLDAFSEERLSSPVIRRLMSRIQVYADPALTAGFPNQRAADVEILLQSGEKHYWHAPYRKGDPEAPLGDGDLDAKFDELAGPVLGKKPASEMRSRIWCLDSLADVRELILIHG